MDEKGLNVLLTTTCFIFRCKFGFSFQMIFVHFPMVSHDMPDQHSGAVVFWIIHLIPTHFARCKHFLFFNLFKMIPYPRGSGICHAVSLSFLDCGSSGSSESSWREWSSVSGLPLEVLVTEFGTVNALETLTLMLEEGKSSVLDVIAFENAKDIGTGLYQIEKCMKGSRLGSELFMLQIVTDY